MINTKIREDKGITLVTLMFAIVIMIIISSMLIYNARSGITTRALNNMYNDIKILKDRVDIYYSKFGTIPTINAQYTNVDNFRNININDDDKYYIIDLEALDNLTLTYGKGYKTYKESQDISITDIYVINGKSHTIYYVEGIELDGKRYYTVPEEYTKIETSIKCNHPKLSTGMTPIKWNGTEFIDTNAYDSEWYDYIDTSVAGQTSSSKWANVRTEDGSMWVWIPRYAYKITYTDSNDKSKGGNIDIVFLKDTTNFDYRGNDVTSAEYVDENGNKGAYIVHPSFQDGRGNSFSNGEWDKELTGFWMAKFEAGYEETSKAKDSQAKHTVIYGDNATTVTNITTNYYGARAEGSLIKYPVFQANRPSMNYLGISDAYDLSRNLTASGNPYGLINVDSHLTKNSEWGAVAYLTHSKYGRNKEELNINNVNVNGQSTVYAVTGYAASNSNAQEDTTRNLSTLTTANQAGSWTTEQGQAASTTGNIYGIYDLSGGLWEWTSGYIATTGNYENYGGSLKGESTKYKTKYAYTENGDSDTSNYTNEENTKKKGEAIWETSSSGTASNSWNQDRSSFPFSTVPFFVRSEAWYKHTDSGIFAFSRDYGYSHCKIGFRPVLVVE